VELPSAFKTVDKNAICELNDGGNERRIFRLPRSTLDFNQRCSTERIQPLRKKVGNIISISMKSRMSPSDVGCFTRRRRRSMDSTNGRCFNTGLVN